MSEVYMFNPALCEQCHKRLMTEDEEQYARSRTVGEILAEGIELLIDVARQNQLSEDAIDRVLHAIIDDRADENRGTWKLH